MIIYITASISGIITMMLLDYVWLAKLAKDFYLEKLSAHITIVNGSLVPYVPAVIGFYIVAIISIWVFVLSKATTLQEAFVWGAILGFLMYAFYDLTNMATLNSWPLKLVLIDILWGTFLMSAIAGVMFYVKSLFS